MTGIETDEVLHPALVALMTALTRSKTLRQGFDQTDGVSFRHALVAHNFCPYSAISFEFQTRQDLARFLHETVIIAKGSVITEILGYFAT
jgi:hypothetical protein